MKELRLADHAYEIARKHPKLRRCPATWDSELHYWIVQISDRLMSQLQFARRADETLEDCVLRGCE